jgi:hypothetical protein
MNTRLSAATIPMRRLVQRLVGLPLWPARLAKRFDDAGGDNIYTNEVFRDLGEVFIDSNENGKG